MIAAERVTVFEGVSYDVCWHAGARPSAMTSTSARCGSASPGGARRCPWRYCAPSRTVSAATVLEGYGLSETSPAVCFNRLNRVRKVGSIGTPIDGVEMRIVAMTMATRCQCDAR